MSHYWDCCKPSCAWDVRSNPNLIKSCDSTGTNIVGSDMTNVCDNLSGSAVCKGYAKKNKQGQYPWIAHENGENILYGYGAIGTDDHDSDKSYCGKCYEITFKNARNIDKAKIMIINGGNSKKGNIDLAVPGGGFGAHDGCKNYSNWKNMYIPSGPCDPNGDNSNCEQYGGIKDETYCTSIFGSDEEALTACKDVLWGVFGQVGCNTDAGYPSNLYFKTKKEITCPSVLTSINKN